MNWRVRGGAKPPLHCADYTVGGSQGGLRGASSPPLWGVGQFPGKEKLDPILGWANLPMVFLVHGFGRDGFRSMVLDVSACINMYCNIKRNIMKKSSW